MLTRPPPAPRTVTTGGPAPGLGASSWRPQPLPCLVFEADEGAQVARHPIISGHTSASTPRPFFVGLERLAHRDLAGPVVPAQQLPHSLGRVPDVKSRPISVLIRPSVQRWSLANPCASGPFPSSSSSRAHCGALSFSHDTGPLDRSASGPPSCQARRHRCADSASHADRAISLIVSLRANRPAVSSRSPSAAAAQRACTGPAAHAACTRHTPATGRRHDLRSTN